MPIGSQGQQRKNYTIGAGSVGRGFDRVAQAIRAKLQDTGSDFSLEVVNTAGSCDNIHRLLSGDIDVALVQYDVAAQAVYAGRLDQTSATADDEKEHASGWMCGVTAREARKKEIQIIAGLFSENVHLLVRTPLRFEDASILDGHKIYIGREGSGSFETGRAILGAAGHLVDQVGFKGSGAEAISLLKGVCAPADRLKVSCLAQEFLEDGRISKDCIDNGCVRTRCVDHGFLLTGRKSGAYRDDERDCGLEDYVTRSCLNPACLEKGGSKLIAMLESVGQGDKGIKALVNTGVVSVEALPEQTIQVLIDHHPYYRVCQIDAGTYNRMHHAVQTVCIATVLVTARSRDQPTAESLAPDAFVDELLQAVIAIESGPANGLDEPLDLTWTGFAEEDVVELHPRADVMVQENRLSEGSRYVAALLAILTAIAAAIVARRRLRKRRVSFRGKLEGHLDNPLLPIIVFIVLLLPSALVVWLFEHDVNVEMRVLPDAFWAMASFATGNFDSLMLKTVGAKAVGVAVTLCGLGFLAWFTAGLTTMFTTGKARFLRRLKNHVIIVNNHPALLSLVRKLRSPGPWQASTVHIVAKGLTRRIRNQLSLMKGVKIHDCDPEVPEDLLELRPWLARCVTVLPPGGSLDSGQNYHPVRVVRAIRVVCKEDETPVTIVGSGDECPAALFLPFRDWVHPIRFRNVVDELVLASLGSLDYLRLVNHLLGDSAQSAALQTVAVHKNQIGKTWSAIRESNQARIGRIDAIMVGVYRLDVDNAPSSPQSIFNPDPQFILQENDSLILLACPLGKGHLHHSK